MADIVSPDKRSQMMAGIRGKNTKPELLIRSAIHRAGFRFRLHVKGLPGKPDLVLPKYNAILFINGCFWHGHSCHLFKMPSTRRDFWQAKITKNKNNDQKNIETLLHQGWRVAVIWECSLRGKSKATFSDVINIFTKWLVSNQKLVEIRG